MHHFLMTDIKRFLHLSVPFIFPVVWSVNEMVMLVVFGRFQFLHKTFHRFHIHFRLFQRTNPVLRCDFVPYFRNLYTLFRLHIPESCQSVIRSPSVKILIYRDYFPFWCLPWGNLREDDKPVIPRKRGTVLFQQPADRGISIRGGSPYTTNLLANGAQPKDEQELLGHSDISTTMNVYAHADREAKRNSAKLLDKVVGSN